MTKPRHKFTQKEDRTIRRYVRDNIGNLQDGFKQAGLELKLSAKSVENHYYKVLKPKLCQHVSLKKLILNQGFFMLSKSRIFINGKNSFKSNFKERWVKDETVNKLLKNL